MDVNNQSALTRIGISGALILIAAGYLIFTVNVIDSRGVFEYAGIDFRVWWGTAEIATDSGFGKIYDLELVGAAQRPLYEEYRSAGAEIPFQVMPMPYLPVFALPFPLLLCFEPVQSLVYFTAFKALVLLLYVRRLQRRFGLEHELWILAAVLFSVPAFMDLFFANVNIWLLVCVGEFALACRGNRTWLAGLWLGGLCIKPQILVLLLPGLLIGRQFKLLYAFAVSSLVILTGSLLLAGPQGLRDLLNLLLGYGNEAGNFPEAMMNWRMVGTQLGTTINTNLAWAIAYTGMGVFFVAALWSWRRPWAVHSTEFAWAFLATLAATCSFTWHSQALMAVVLLAPMLWLYRERGFSHGSLTLWLLLPSVAFLAVYFLQGTQRAHTYPAVVLFVLHAVILTTCLRRLMARPQIS